MTELSKWDILAVNAILSTKDFKIQQVNDYESIKSLTFDQKQYQSIASLLRNKDWESIEALTDSKGNFFGEYLDIIKFSSQDGSQYIATVYDSDELWQDPEVIEIIPLN